MALPTKRRREQAQARTREGGAQSRAHSVLLGLRTPARRCPREHRMSRTWTREQTAESADVHAGAHSHAHSFEIVNDSRAPTKPNVDILTRTGNQFMYEPRRGMCHVCLIRGLTGLHVYSCRLCCLLVRLNLEKYSTVVASAVARHARLWTVHGRARLFRVRSIHLHHQPQAHRHASDRDLRSEVRAQRRSPSRSRVLVLDKTRRARKVRTAYRRGIARDG